MTLLEQTILGSLLGYFILPFILLIPFILYGILKEKIKRRKYINYLKTKGY